MTESDQLAYACGFSEDETGGLFRYTFDSDTGALEHLDTTALEAASFLEIHPEGTHLYAVSEASEGAITSYRIDEETGELTKLNRQSTGGAGACFVSIDGPGEYAFVSNYPAGTISMLPIREDGSLEEASDVVEHEGSSVDPDRQTEPHPHSIAPGPQDRFVYVPDLGTDHVMIYRIDREDGSLRPAQKQSVSLHNGAGPRHVDFHPNGEVMYLINELDSTVVTFDYDPSTGSLEQRDIVSALPESFEGTSYTAEIAVHPSGEWVYGSNRGHDSITQFDVESDGTVDPIAHVSTGGHWPRHFTIDPTGEYLLAENRRSDSVESFEIDDNSGALTQLEESISLPEPICVAFLDRT